MHEAATSPGKRLRPALAQLVAEVFGAPAARLLDAACVSSSSTPPRSCSTICRAWTTPSCGAAAPRCTGGSARRSRCSPPSRCSSGPGAPAGRAGGRRRGARAPRRADPPARRGRRGDVPRPGARPRRGAPADDARRPRVDPRRQDRRTVRARCRAGRGGGRDQRRPTRRAARLRAQPRPCVPGRRRPARRGRQRARIGKPTGRDAALGRLTFVSLLGVPGAATIRDELVAAAIDALGVLGDRSAPLVELADHVRTRSS